MPSLRPLRLAAAVAMLAAPAQAEAASPLAPFEIQEIASEGRVVAAELEDVDGDGLGDLLALHVRGIPPDERREVQVRFGRGDGPLPASPEWRAPLPPDVAAYDVGDTDGRPGAELVLLAGDRLALLSLAGRTAAWREVLVPDATAAPQPDERGLDRLRLLRPELGAGRLLVPGLGTAAVLAADGAVLGRPRIGGRANYFLPPRPGPLISENEIEIFYDVPRLELGDVDGDGRADLLAASRHEVRVFRQRPGGRFEAEPDQRLALRLLSPDDHVRNAGGVRVAASDLDGDGRADLLVSHASGGLMRAVTRTRIHLNRAGAFRLDAPDQVFEDRGGLVVDDLLDLDGDRRPELVRLFLPLGLTDLAEIFLQRSLDVEAKLHRATDGGRFEETPWMQRAFDVGLDLETMRPRGFVPVVTTDWNADGRLDLLTPAGGEGLEVWLGAAEKPFSERAAQQPLDARGRLRPGSLGGDRLPDFVLYDQRRDGASIRIGRNRGTLPGTAPGIREARDE